MEYANGSKMFATVYKYGIELRYEEVRGYI